MPQRNSCNTKLIIWEFHLWISQITIQIFIQSLKHIDILKTIIAVAANKLKSIKSHACRCRNTFVYVDASIIQFYVDIDIVPIFSIVFPTLPLPHPIILLSFILTLVFFFFSQNFLTTLENKILTLDAWSLFCLFFCCSLTNNELFMILFVLFHSCFDFDVMFLSTKSITKLKLKNETKKILTKQQNSLLLHKHNHHHAVA